MFKDLTYKKKNLYLRVGVLVFGFIIYFFAIDNTIALYKENKLVKGKSITAEDAEVSTQKLQTRLNTLNQFFSLYNADSVQSPQFVLETVSNICRKRNVVLKNFPRPNFTTENGFTIETNTIEAEGSFLNLLFLINDLEKVNDVGRISSISYKSFKDNRSKKLVLTLVIYLQSIKHSYNESEA